MKFNISFPLTGGQKTYEIDDDKKCSIFYDKRMGQHVEADQLGDEYKGYVFKITGGNDKQGFAMRQGILVKGRCRILMSKGGKGYRPRRTGERKRKSIRGCIVGQDIRVLALSIVKKGDAELDGVTNVNIPRRLGPKRLTRLRRLFGFKKEDGVALVKKNIIRRTWTTKDGKKRQKAPKIQRLVTDSRLRRRRLIQKVRDSHRLRIKEEGETYRKLLAELRKKLRKRSSEVSAPAKAAAPAPAQTQGKPVAKTTAPVAKKDTKQAPTGKQAPAPAPAKPQTQTQGKPQTTQQPAQKQAPAPAPAQAPKTTGKPAKK